MGRATAVGVLALLALWVPAARADPAPLTLAPAIPPDLAALEAKADALQITSQRVALSSELRLGGHTPKGLRELLKLFELKIEGVETIAPPAAALKMTLFGSHLRLRYVGGHAYLFSWALGLHDGGRPWIELGHGLLGRLLRGSRRAQGTPSTSGAQRYAKLFTLVNNGVGIHELAPSVLYGQAVTGFQETLDPKTLAASGESGGGSAGGAFAGRAFGAARHPPAPPRPVPAPRRQITLSTYFAASGAVVREQIETGSATVGSTLTVDTPAIDFPYTIPPPPASHVISEKRLLRRFPPRRERAPRSSQSKQ